jgi:hypothetical protein
MGVSRQFRFRFISVLRTGCLFIAFLAFAGLTGCQDAVSSTELQIHQASLDRDGLTPLHFADDVKVTCAPPDLWDKLPAIKTILYTHQQWRSSDRHVGMGVAYIHMPLPFSAHTLIWFAKGQYSQSEKVSSKGGRLIGQWDDALGRSWFEAENQTFHVKGYAIAHGFDAWIVYSGYRVQANPTPEQIELAEKGAESVAPIFDGR